MSKDFNFFSVVRYLRTRVIAGDNELDPISWKYQGNSPDNEAIVVVPSANDALAYSDILKFSQNKDIIIKNFTIYGGKEDCIDIVRGTNYSIMDCSLIPQGQAGITVKGSVKGLYISNLLFLSHGKQTDIDLGNWEDYSYFPRPKTRKIVLHNVHASDGKPVKVRVLHSEIPEIIDSNIKLVVYPRIVVALFFWAKRILSFLGLGKKMSRKECVLNLIYEVKD